MNVFSGHQDLHEIAKCSELFFSSPFRGSLELNLSGSVVCECWLALSAERVMKIQEFTELQLEYQRLLETVLNC